MVSCETSITSTPLIGMFMSHDICSWSAPSSSRLLSPLASWWRRCLRLRQALAERSAARQGPVLRTTASRSPARCTTSPSPTCPAPFATEAANNGPKVVPRPEDAWPQAPPGFTVKLYADGLGNPRLIRMAPNGDVFVVESEAGRCASFAAGSRPARAAWSGCSRRTSNRPFGIAFYPPGGDPRWVYVANTDSSCGCPYKNGDSRRAARRDGRAGAAGGGRLRGGGHWTRDIAFSRDGKRMFVSVGSRSNVDDPDTTPAEKDRAAVLEFAPDGSGRRVYASGIRNAVGIAVHPRSGELWASVNERDELGDNLVPDYITHVDEGGFYGWPWYYIGGNPDPRHQGKHPELKDTVDRARRAAAAAQRLAADGLLRRQAVPRRIRGRHLRGRSTARGTRRCAPATTSSACRCAGCARPATTRIFLSGFVTADGQVWGRPGRRRGREGRRAAGHRRRLELDRGSDRALTCRVRIIAELCAIATSAAPWVLAPVGLRAVGSPFGRLVRPRQGPRFGSAEGRYVVSSGSGMRRPSVAVLGRRQRLRLPGPACPASLQSRPTGRRPATRYARSGADRPHGTRGFVTITDGLLVISALLGADVRGDLPASPSARPRGQPRYRRPASFHVEALWIAHQLTRDPLHLFDANIFYPAKNTLAFSDAMLVPALMAAPLIWLGVPQLVVYNLLLLSGFALSGGGMFLLVRSLTGHRGGDRRRLRLRVPAVPVHALRPPRAADGAVDAALPVGVSSHGRAAAPARRPVHRPLPRAPDACPPATTASSSRPSWCPSGGASPMGATIANSGRSLRALAAGAVLAGVLVVPVTVPYFAARKSVGERPLSEIEFYSATPQDYLVAHPRNTLFGQRMSVGRSQERELFEGVVVPAVALVGALAAVLGGADWLLRRPGAGVRLSLGTNGSLYPWLQSTSCRSAACACRRGWRSWWACRWPFSWDSPSPASRGRELTGRAGRGGGRDWPGRLSSSTDSTLVLTCGDRPPVYDTLRRTDERAAGAAADRAGHRPRTDLHVFLDLPLAPAGERLQRLQPASRTRTCWAG